MGQRTRNWGKRLLLGTALMGLLALPVMAEKGQIRQVFGKLGLLPSVSEPPQNPSSPAKVELGNILFFDSRLSGDGKLACVSCHIPGLGWADGRTKGIGYRGKPLPRNVPTLLNAAYYDAFFHDGRTLSLEEQAKGPILNPDEMHGDAEQIAATLKGIPEYRERFHAVFNADPSLDTAAAALAAFERTIVSKNSAFDHWIEGDDGTLSPAARRGLELFTNKADCTSCHKGPNFSDGKYHNIGIPGSGTTDRGRFEVTKKPSDLGAFKTPSLRNVALTGPYMHDGSVTTLFDAVKHYQTVDLDFPNLDPLIDHWDLSDQDVSDIVEFLKALTGEPVPVHLPKLPGYPTLSQGR
ncbi:MAG TPA: cytochrome c peroxidase [Stenomitos sp.]